MAIGIEGRGGTLKACIRNVSLTSLWCPVLVQITFAGVTGLRWKRIAHRRKEDHAARVIQGLLKIIRAKRTLEELKEERRRNIAAIKIQTIWRGYVARLRLALMKYLSPFAVVIQVSPRTRSLTKDCTRATQRRRGGAHTRCFCQVKFYEGKAVTSCIPAICDFAAALERLSGSTH